MASFYNRDAFSDLMSELAAQARITGSPAYKGGNKNKGGSGGDLFQNLADAGAFGTAPPVGPTVQTGPGFSVGSIGSTAYLPTSTAPTSGFSIGSDSRMSTSLNAVPFTSNVADYGFTTEGTGLASLVANAVGGVGAFQPLDRLYPGDVGYYPGLDPDSAYAAQGLTRNPITGKIIDLSKYGQGTDATASTTGTVPTSTGTTTAPGVITTTGQQTSGTGLTAANVDAGIFGAGTPIAGEVLATTKKEDDETVTLTGGTPTVPAVDLSNITGEITATAKKEEDKPTFLNTALNTAVNAASNITGLPLDKVYEVVTTGQRPDVVEIIDNALGNFGLNIGMFEPTGNTYVDSPYELLMGDGQGTDMSGMNDNTTAGGYDPFAIPGSAAVRSVVPGTYDPNRRAGSGGQRYFSDIQYAPQGGIAAAQAATQAQAQQLAAANILNPAYQLRPGAATDRATSMAQRAAGLAGLIPNTLTGAIPLGSTDTTAGGTTTGGTTTGGTTGGTTTGGTTTGGTTTGGTTTGGTTGGTTAVESPYTYTSESLFQGIDPSDGFDETEIGRVAALLNQNYTTAGQVGEFFDMNPEDVNRYLSDYNTRADLIKNLGLTEGQTSLSIDQLNQLGDSGLAMDYLASTFGIGEDVLSRAIEGAQTDRTLSGVDTVGGISTDDQKIIADLLTSGKTDIGNVAEKYGVEGMDVVEGLLRGGYETPAQMVERLAPQNEGLTEVDLITNLLNTGRAKPEEIASYYRANDPNYANLTTQDVENELAKINTQRTSDYLTGLSDEEVGALINAGDLTVGQAVGFYQDRYPGLSEADVKAALKAQGYAQGGPTSMTPKGMYLGGSTDGMADQIPATINDMQPAALSDGEFVIPADVVSHLGNGNSDAGAKELYSMMDRIRNDRTGTTKQGRQIDPNKYLA